MGNWQSCCREANNTALITVEFNRVQTPSFGNMVKNKGAEGPCYVGSSATIDTTEGFLWPEKRVPYTIDPKYAKSAAKLKQNAGWSLADTVEYCVGVFNKSCVKWQEKKPDDVNWVEFTSLDEIT